MSSQIIGLQILQINMFWTLLYGEIFERKFRKTNRMMLKVLNRQSLKNVKIIYKKTINNAIDSFHQRLGKTTKADGGYIEHYKT